MDRARLSVLLGVGAVAVAAGLAISAFWAVGRAETADRAAGKAVERPELPSTTASRPPPTSATGPGEVGPYTGPGLTSPGIRVLASPNAFGDLEVVERVIFPSPRDWVFVAPPSTAGASGLAGVKPRLEDLQASADDQLVAVRSPGTVTAQVRLQLPPSTRAVELRYRLTGASKRSLPAPPGRVLVVLPPVTAAGLGNLPVVVEVSGRSIRNLVCPRLPVGQQLCGRQRLEMWLTPSIPAARASVIAQLDLPEPG